MCGESWRKCFFFRHEHIIIDSGWMFVWMIRWVRANIVGFICVLMFCSRRYHCSNRPKKVEKWNPAHTVVDYLCQFQVLETSICWFSWCRVRQIMGCSFSVSRGWQQKHPQRNLSAESFVLWHIRWSKSTLRVIQIPFLIHNELKLKSLAISGTYFGGTYHR